MMPDMKKAQNTFNRRAEDLREKIPLAPAIVTWIRLLVLPVAAIMIYTKGISVFVFWIILLAALSDYFDGWLARRLKKTSYGGKILDFIADKFFLSVMFLVLGKVNCLDHTVAGILVAYHLLILLGIAVISWSVSIPVVAIPTGERVVIIFSYVLVVVSTGSMAFPDKGIFVTLSRVGRILAVCSVFFGFVSYLRVIRRMLMRFR